MPRCRLIVFLSLNLFLCNPSFLPSFLPSSSPLWWPEQEILRRRYNVVCHPIGTLANHSSQVLMCKSHFFFFFKKKNACCFPFHSPLLGNDFLLRFSLTAQHTHNLTSSIPLALYSQNIFKGVPYMIDEEAVRLLIEFGQGCSRQPNEAGDGGMGERSRRQSTESMGAGRLQNNGESN